jgi:hypothetical protein
MTSALGHIALDARTATDHFPGIGRYVVNYRWWTYLSPLSLFASNGLSLASCIA